MDKFKEHLKTIITFAAVVSIVIGFCAYFAKASELELVAMRLEQKIVGDKVFDLKKRTWQLEDRNTDHDIIKWPKRDRDEYRLLMEQIKQEEQKLKSMEKK